jgi:hypothetical protein
MTADIGGDFYMLGSDLDVKGDAEISADRIGIEAAVDREEYSYEKTVVKTGLAAGVSLSGGKLSVEVAKMEKNKEYEGYDKEIASESAISTGGNLKIISKGDTNIIGSALEIGGEGEIEAGGDLNVKAKELSYKTYNGEENETTTISVSIGNSYVDAGYAGKALYEAEQALEQSISKLKEMEKLYDEGKASKRAVEDAKANVGFASANVAQATIAFTSSVSGAAQGAASSLGTGFYASVSATTEGSKTRTDGLGLYNYGSAIMSGGNLSLTSKSGSINQVGSAVESANGDLRYTAKEDVNIIASQDAYDERTTSENYSGSVSYGSGGFSGSVGGGLSNSATNSTTYNNSGAVAKNGKVIINAGGDLNLIGGNVNAKETEIDVKNLNIESLQDTYYSSSSGVNASVGGGAGNSNVGVGNNSTTTDIAWVNQQSGILTSGAADIKVENETNLKGGYIASERGDLSLETGSLNYEEVKDRNYSENSGFNLAVSVGGSSDKQEKAKYPTGQTTIGVQSGGSESEQINKATIGSGTIIVGGKDVSAAIDVNRDLAKGQEITRDQITGALDGSITIDNRLLTSEGRESIASDFVNLDTNVKIAGYGAVNTTSNILETAYTVLTDSEVGITETADLFKAKQSQQVTALTRGANEGAREILNNLSKGQDVNDIEGALGLGVKEDSSKIYYSDDDKMYGFNDKDTKESYINAGVDDTIVNTNNLLFVDAHERSHTYTGNEAIANTAGSEAQSAWGITNWIYGDSINTSGRATSNSWINSQMSNASSANTLAQNTIAANRVSVEDRNPKIYIDEKGRVLATDGVDDGKVKEMSSKDYAKMYMEAEGETESGILKIKQDYDVEGVEYDLDDAKQFKELSGRTDMKYIIGEEGEMIYYQNGMKNDEKGAKEGAELLKALTGQEIGIINNQTQGLAGDVKEYFNGLTMKDVLNAKVYEDIANNGEHNTVIMFSAGNKDGIKALEVLALEGRSLGGKVEFISVGSPVGQKALENAASKVDGKVIGQYNDWKDPVTNPSIWVGGTLALATTGFVGGIVGGGAIGASIATDAGAMATYFSAL